MEKFKRMIVSPLPWGMGHATRLSCIAQFYQKHGYQVDVALDSKQQALAAPLFKDMKIFEVPGFTLSYPRRFKFFLYSIHFLRFFIYLFREHYALKKLIRQNNQRPYNLIVSDNRYGFWNKDTSAQNIFLTHQLFPVLPNFLLGRVFIDRLIFNLLKLWIKPFQEVWVPDSPGSLLSGFLSHEGKKKSSIHPHIKYIGWLVAFNQSKIDLPQYGPSWDSKSVLEVSIPNFFKEKIEWFVLISGPDPWREIFYREALAQFKGFPQKTVIVAGKKVEIPDTNFVENQIHCFSYINPAGVKVLLEQSSKILCRPGYTTLMELASLKIKQVAFVPTPDQSEQEYLATHLQEKKVGPWQSQNTWSLKFFEEKLPLYSGFSGLEWDVPIFPQPDFTWN